MTTKRLAHHNAVAVYDTVEDALASLEALRAEGISDDELSLLGPEHVLRPGTGDVTENPSKTSGGIGKGAVTGIAAGGGTGAALGALGAMAVAAIPGVGLAVGAAAGFGALAGLASGHIAGGLIGAETGARKSMMWEQTLQPLLTRVERGQVLLGVHSDDEERVAEAEEVLDRATPEPLEVHRLDADEAFGSPGDEAAFTGRSTPSSHAERPGGELGRDVADGREDTKNVSTEVRGDDTPH